MWRPVGRYWRLNERHYGALQGLNQAETAQKHSEEQVFIWRRSFDVPPPALEPDDERWPGADRRYAMLPPKAVPLAESLKDTIARVEPYFVGEIAPQIAQGKRVLIAAHGNRSEEQTSELQSLMSTSYAVFCLTKKKNKKTHK